MRPPSTSRLQRITWYIRSTWAYERARRRGLVGQEYFRFGRLLGWELRRQNTAQAWDWIVRPVSSTRYFEFAFAQSCLPQELGACLDVSSPVLFDFFVVRQYLSAQVCVVNPDRNDLNRTRAFLQALSLPNIRTEETDVYRLPTCPDGYDAIWSLSVLEHIAGARGDDRDAVRRLWAALRPGGRLILTVPTDKRAWDEYRDNDPYGTQPKSGADGAYFFQRFYDEAAIRSRIVAAIGQGPSRLEWFGEKTAGHFHAYIARWRREGTAATLNDPLDIAMNYETYPSFTDMPGAGVCGLLFIKP